MRDVEIVLDRDEPRVLRFTWGALRDLQRISGQSLVAFAGSMAEVSPQHVIWGLWAGLKHAHPKLKPEQVDPLVEKYLERGGTLDDLMRTLDEALTRSGLLKPRGSEDADSLDPPPAPDSPPI